MSLSFFFAALVASLSNPCPWKALLDISHFLFHCNILVSFWGWQHWHCLSDLHQTNARLMSHILLPWILWECCDFFFPILAQSFVGGLQSVGQLPVIWGSNCISMCQHLPLSGSSLLPPFVGSMGSHWMSWTDSCLSVAFKVFFEEKEELSCRF